MPNPSSPSARARRRLAAFALALTLAPAAAEAGWPHDYSLRWYGEDFYARRPKPYRNADGRIRMQNTPSFGPPMIYSREYGDAFPGDVVRDQPFTPDHSQNRAIAGTTPFIH